VTGSITCLKNFMKKCGTPIQRELFDFMMEQFVESVNLFCNTPETRKGESNDAENTCAKLLILAFVRLLVQCSCNTHLASTPRS
jgi:hypothetical protein